MTGITHSRAGAHGIRRTSDRPLRALVALALLVSAGVHLWLWWFDDFRLIDWIGPLFLLNVVAGVALAVAVVVWPHWLPVLGAIGFGLATFVAFALSATVGLLGVNEPWMGGPQVTAWLAEIVCVLAGGLVLLRERPRVSSD
jgi:hypothetical protein